MKWFLVIIGVLIAIGIALFVTACGNECPKGYHEVQDGTHMQLMPMGKVLIPMQEPTYVCVRN